MTTQEFIDKAQLKHGDKCDYSKSNYIGSKETVIIICRKHGDFNQKPNHHLTSKYPCPKCGSENKNRFRVEKASYEFADRANKKHGKKYDYSEVEYVNSKFKVKITCNKHGAFYQMPYNHLKGEGCPNCGSERGNLERVELARNTFISRASRAHDGKYDYSKSVYVNALVKMTITCHKHGDFKQRPHDHISGQGCYKCRNAAIGNASRLTTSEFIERAKKEHNDSYVYKNVKYIHSLDKVDIICKEHGSFRQSPADHLRGKGCPQCTNKAEGKVLNKLRKTLNVETQLKIESRRFDFYLPEYNLIIERDGEQHYGPVTFGSHTTDIARQHRIDIEKTKLAKINGYKMARIPYWLNSCEIKTEINNILSGNPTYPDIPDLSQQHTKPKPNFQKAA